MTDETENNTIRLLQEIRAAQKDMSARLDEANSKLDQTNTKVDRLAIEVLGVKGRIRNVEKAVEAIARVISDSVLG